MADSTVSYRYFVTDLLTNQVVTELPLTDVSYSKALKDAGEMSASVAIGPSTSPLSLYANTMPGKSGLYVMRNGECVWGGIIWSRDYDIVGKTLNLQANEFTSYLHHRKIWKTWNLQHDGILVYLDQTNSNQYIIELNPDTNDRVSLPEGTAVELVFSDAKGVPFNGHYKVNKDFYGAKKITVDREPLRSTYQPVLDGRFAQSYLKSGYKTTEISTRSISNGSSEVIIETEEPHQLAVGDVIDINGLDTHLDPQKIATTYATRSKSYDIQALGDSNIIKSRKGTVSTSEDTDTIKNINTTGIKLNAVFEQDGNNGLPGIMPSIFLNPPTVVVDITTSTELYGQVVNGSNVISDMFGSSLSRGQKLNIISGPLADCTITDIKVNEGKIVVDKKATGTGQIKIALNRQNGALVMSRVATRSGELSGIFKNRENGFSHTKIKSENTGTKKTLNTYEFTFTAAEDKTKDSWVNELKVGDLIIINGVNRGDDNQVPDPIFGNTSSDAFKYKTVKRIDKKNRKITFEHQILATTYGPLILGIDGKPVLPTEDSSSNAEFAIVDVTRTPIAGGQSPTATCLNGKTEIPVIKVISKTKFVVDPGCADATYDEPNISQPTAKVVWKKEYQATMHTHTDTYDQVRHLLTNVFEDFVKLEYVNPFLGNLEKYQIRTAKYDPATDLATLTTGFIKSVYSKEIKTEQEVTGLVATLATGTNSVTLTTGSTAKLKVNQLLTKSSGTGAFGNSGVVYVETIVDSTKFTVSRADNTDQNHATAGSITFGAGDLELVAEIGLSTPYSQFVLSSENSESNDINEEIIVSGNDPSINGIFKIKSISADKTKITYELPEQTDINSRVRAISYPAINDSKIVFGKHNLVDGSNITITGLTNQNYDGSFAIRDILDEVSFTYKPAFETVGVDKVAIGKQRSSDSKYPVTLYLSKKPNTAKYAYIPGQTKISVSNMGAPYDSVSNVGYTISSMDLDAGTPSITYLVDSATTHATKDADHNDRKYGDIYTVSKAAYVRSVSKQNLISNPSFETDTTDWVSPSSGFTLARNTANFYSGVASLRLTNSTGVQYAKATNRPSGTRLAVTAGQTYTFSYYIKKGTSTSNWFASIKGFAASSGGSDIFITDGTASSLDTNGLWTRRSVTATIPASGVNYIEGWIVNSATDIAGAIVYVDAVMLELSSKLGTYVDDGVPTGNGTVTYKTSAAHTFSPGDTVAISNVGDVFTQKTGSTNAYSEIVVAIATVPNNTSFTTNNQGLYGVNYNYDLSLGQFSVAEISPSTATVRYYDPSNSKTNALPPSIKIDDLPDVNSPLKNKITVLDRAFNKDDTMAILKIGSNPGFYEGGTVVVDGVDGRGESVFDGTFTISEIKKIADGNWRLSYTTNNKKIKKDFGSFKDITPKDKSKVRTLQTYEGNSGGTVVQESWVYVGSYGSYPGSSDIGIEFSTQAYSGNYMRSDRYDGHALKGVGEALATYADKFITRPGTTKSIRNIYGFDYRINCVYDYDTESFRRIFTFIPVHYPNEPLHGETSPLSRFGADKVVFEYPGNIQSVSLKESSENASTRFWMVGSDGGTGTTGATKTYVGVAAKDLLNSNWPLLELENSDDKLDFLVDISDYAYRYLSETQPPTGEFTVTVNGSLDPVVNTYQPSDWCSIIVNDPFVQERLSSDLEPRDTVIVRKITAYTVDVPNNPSFPEQVSLTLIPEWDVDKRGQ